MWKSFEIGAAEASASFLRHYRNNEYPILSDIGQGFVLPSPVETQFPSAMQLRLQFSFARRNLRSWSWRFLIIAAYSRRNGRILSRNSVQMDGASWPRSHPPGNEREHTHENDPRPRHLPRPIRRRCR